MVQSRMGDGQEMDLPPPKKKKNILTQKQIETYRIKFIAALFAKAKHEKQVSIIGDEMSKLQ